MEGKIKNLVQDKNFGFIKVEGREKDLFFHANSLVPGVNFMDLKVGDMVSFDEADSPKGPNAVNVALVSAE
ncbi:cold shock domain-containing protein [Candidatus Parcubacteria bacterium]|nr:cold shock domain-containing protein [Candidatus Parcubacteria bacterium]